MRGQVNWQECIPVGGAPLQWPSGGGLNRGCLPKGVCVSAQGAGVSAWGCLPRGVCLSRGVSARMTDSCKNITLLIRDFFSKGKKV